MACDIGANKLVLSAADWAIHFEVSFPDLHVVIVPHLIMGVNPPRWLMVLQEHLILDLRVFNF